MADNTDRSGNPALAITDELARAISFIRAAHMAANALTAEECDAIQEVLDAAEKSVETGRVLVAELLPQRAAA